MKRLWTHQQSRHVEHSFSQYLTGRKNGKQGDRLKLQRGEHRITEQLRLTGNHPVCYHLVAQDHVQLSFECLQGGRERLHNSSGVVRGNSNISLLEFPLTFTWNFLRFSFFLLSFHWAPLGRVWLCLLYLPIQMFIHIDKFLLSLPFNKLFSQRSQCLRFISCLTSADQRRIASLNIPAMPFLGQPWRLLALFAARAHCWLLMHHGVHQDHQVLFCKAAFHLASPSVLGFVGVPLKGSDSEEDQEVLKNGPSSGLEVSVRWWNQLMPP